MTPDAATWAKEVFEQMLNECQHDGVGDGYEICRRHGEGTLTKALTLHAQAVAALNDQIANFKSAVAACDREVERWKRVAQLAAEVEHAKTAQAVAQAVREEREACARYVDDLAAALDQVAAENLHHDWIHGALTDQACALFNIATDLRARCPQP